MKTQRRLVATALLVSVLLTLLGGSMTSAAAVHTVTTASELAYEPLAQSASVAYEQHEDGYAVSLDRTADSVTMNITAAPASAGSRTAEKARLYIQTGVELNPGTTYQVSFSLSAKQAQPEYAVCFDSGTAEAAYGTLNKRSIEAGGMDRVRYLITPKEESGALVLRLLLGKTEASGNTLRFSDLSVEEAPKNEVGKNVVLADSLDYRAPGFIQLWTNSDSAAVITSDEQSATLNVTKGPTGGAEVWKIKLLVATGLTPKAGKTYHFTADAVSTAVRSFELCFNEGDTEKGFGAEYSQRLTGREQKLDYMIHIPADKKDAGELMIQFSLGMLKTGDKVTLSNISLEEAVPSYRKLDFAGFSLAKDSHGTDLGGNTHIDAGKASVEVHGSRSVATNVNWNATSTVTASGDKIGGLTTFGNRAALEIQGGRELWDARFNIHTDTSLKAGTTYRVSFQIEAEKAYSEYEVLYGTALNGVDNNQAYGSLKGLSLTAGHTEKISYQFVPELSGGLLISLQVGKTNGGNNTVTVSDFRIEEMAPGEPGNGNLATEVVYPGSAAPAAQAETPGSFSVRADGKYGGTITGDGSSATMTCTGGDAGDGSAWKRGMFTGDICQLSAGTTYLVSFDITATQNTSYEVCYNKDGDWDAGEKGFGWKGGLTASSASSTATYTVTPSENGKLRLRIDLGRAAEGTQIKVSNIKVEEAKVSTSYGNDIASVNYSGVTARDNKGTITSTDNSATMTCPAQEAKPEAWQRGMFIGDICQLSAGTKYLVSFDITAAKDTFYDVLYNKDKDWDEGEGAFGKQFGLTASSASSTATYTVTPSADGKLRLRIDLGLAEKDTEVTVSNIKVEEITEEFKPSGKYLEIGVVYPDNRADPTPTPTPSQGTFAVRADGEYGGTITGDGISATITCTGGDAGDGSAWKRGMFTGDICQLSAGTTYLVSFDITATQNTSYEVCYNKDGDWDAGEKGFGWKGGLTASSARSTAAYTVTPSADGKLRLRIDLGRAAEGAQITVSNIKVQEIPYNPVPGSEQKIDGFCSVWEDVLDGYTADLQRGDNNATLRVMKPDSVETAGWKAKLFIRTGVAYDPNKGYRASFDITAEDALDDFCVIWQGVPDNEDLRGTWGLSIGAGETKTVTTRAFPASMFTSDSGELVLQLELGNLKGAENTYTIRNVRVEELDVTVNYPYSGTFACRGYAAILELDETPIAGEMKPGMSMDYSWKVKVFTNTGIYISKGDTYRVTYDVQAREAMNFETAYNRKEINGDTIEKGYGSTGATHAASRKQTPVEHFFTASEDGTLEVQFMLGEVTAPNRVMVTNLKVERVTYSYSGKSALPAPPDYRAPGAVSYWAHGDYAANFTNTEKAITANITSAPAKGAEPWKIKLFLDTGVVLQPGKYYKVSSYASAKTAQDYEICYNNGGIEMGYDAAGGLRLTGGETQLVERIISVPTDKKDTGSLMLQFNLGKTTVANAVTISGVKVEEVSLSYTDMMEKNFAYKVGRTVSLWTNSDYTAHLEDTNGKAALHITGVPAAAEVWKVKLLVHTGAMLSAGKTYLVRADLQAAKAQNYEVCFNNEETEKGFDALYNQALPAGTRTVVEKKISVPDSMTDAGELVLQFSVGGAVTNDITVSGVSVQELHFGTGGGGNPAPDTVISLDQAPQAAAGTLSVTREKLTYSMTKISSESGDNTVKIAGANLRPGDRYTVTFKARADKDLTGTLVLQTADGRTTALSAPFRLTSREAAYSFAATEPLSEGGFYHLLWQFGSPDNQKLDGAEVEISNISVYSPAETLQITHSAQNITVNGKPVKPDAYNINGNNYFKLSDLAALLNDTNAQFVVRYNSKNNLVSLTTGKPYTPAGGELKIGADQSASCVQSPQNLAVNGEAVNLKVYNIGGYNFFRLGDLDDLLGFHLNYVAASNTVAIASPLTPEAQEKAHSYDIFFLPEVDGEAQPYVGDTMPFYEDGVYYIYYLKDGGDSYNHSVYLATTRDFVHYTEMDEPVLSASREDVQDNWIGTGSVVKVDKTYYFFYTGFNASGSQEYHEKIMVAKGSSPTSFEKVSGWEIVPPASLGQKNDFRDPQAYYDAATQTISLTITAGQDGAARILKYTLGKDLQNAKYDGIIYTDPTGAFWNMECSDTFKIGDKWYLTYSGQDDTLWYAMADSRFGPYTDPARLEGKLFYAAKHVEDGKDAYMVGWARRANSASSTQEVSGWAGNIAVQKLKQLEDGRLALVPVDSIVSAFQTQRDLVLGASETALTAGSDYRYKAAFTSYESFMLRGEFTYTGTGTFGLAFDFNGREEQYKLISMDPAANKLELSFNEGATPITETQATLRPNQKHSFTYIQDGSVGIFYLDNQAALLVRLYGSTDKPIYLFAENNNVTFTSLQQYTR